MKKLTATWVKKAEDDFKTARKLMRGNIQLYDQLCFHCQQSAEKYLKALFQEFGLPISRTHDLHVLLKALPPHLLFAGLGRGAVFLRQFAVATRYPGDDATRGQSRAAMRWARRFRDFARTVLGIPQGRKRSK